MEFTIHLKVFLVLVYFLKAMIYSKIKYGKQDYDSAKILI